MNTDQYYQRQNCSPLSVGLLFSVVAIKFLRWGFAKTVGENGDFQPLYAKCFANDKQYG